MRFQLDRSFFIPKDSTILKEVGTAIVYGYNIPTGKVGALAFQGKAQKPAWHYSFKDEQSRQKHIDSWFHNLDLHTQFMTERKQKRQEEVATADIKPGQYFSTSWGYDQTNIDFLVVVRVTAKTAICRMASPIYLGESGQQDVLMPGVADGEPFRMQISGKASLTGSYPFCPGSMRLGYFSRTQLGAVHYETMAQFGH